MRFLVLIICALGMTVCTPQKQATVEEIPRLKSLDDLMAVQATYADPQFKKIGQSSFTDAELANLGEVAARLEATSQKIKDFSKGPGFDSLATRLQERAQSLAAAVQAKDASAVSTSLREMKATCKECHSKFR